MAIFNSCSPSVSGPSSMASAQLSVRFGGSFMKLVPVLESAKKSLRETVLLAFTFFCFFFFPPAGTQTH